MSVGLVVRGRQNEYFKRQKFALRLKPTSAYENMRNYYSLIAGNHFRVSVTFCGRLHGGVFTKDILQRQPNQHTIINYLVNLYNVLYLYIGLIVTVTYPS
jgi:hypothetical protein